METADLDSALLLTQEHDDLDLILLDLNMPGMHGLNGLINLRNEAPTIPVVIVSAEQDKQIVLQAITYGAVGFITKSSPRLQMTEAIQQILNGNVYLPPDIIRTQKPGTHRRMNDNPSFPPELLQALTRKQLLVLERMTKGESNKQIAYTLKSPKPRSRPTSRRSCANSMCTTGCKQFLARGHRFRVLSAALKHNS